MTAPLRPQLAASDEETLGEVVKDIRKSLREKQDVFAKRFHVSRQYISAHESERELIKGFAQQLSEEFKNESKRIWDAYEVSRSRRPVTRGRRPESQLHRKVEQFMRSGRFGFARGAIREALIDESDERERHWLYERLAACHIGSNHERKAIEALESAIGCAIGAQLRDEELSSRDRLAAYHQQRVAFSNSLAVLDSGLQRYPDAARLWLRKGKVHWYEQTYSLAYAALTTALTHGSKRSSVLHARGQVLAEWGNFDAALADIEEYLKGKNKRVVNIAPVRATRAYVLGMTGRLSDALSEFDEAERLNSGSAWTQYRRALCYIHNGEHDAAVQRLNQALQFEGPKLNPPRRTHALTLLDQYSGNPKAGRGSRATKR